MFINWFASEPGQTAFTEAFHFTLRMLFLRNLDMIMNGRFPTAVADFKYEIHR